MSAVRTRVTIVDDHELFAEALVLALQLDGFAAVAVVPDRNSTGQAVVRDVADTRPDIVLLDLDLGSSRSGMSLLPALVTLRTSVIVVSGKLDRARAGEALSLGAARAIPKSAPLDEIVQTIRRLSAGLTVVSREEAQDLMNAWTAEKRTQRDLRGRLDRLTTREAEVLGQLMAGIPVAQIARNRFVSESTVRTQVKSVLAKLRVSSQLMAVGVAHQAGWKPPATDERSVPASHRVHRVRAS